MLLVELCYSWTLGPNVLVPKQKRFGIGFVHRTTYGFLQSMLYDSLDVIVL